MKPTDQQPHRHSPDAQTAQAAQGRALRKHLAANPFPKQGANA